MSFHSLLRFVRMLTAHCAALAASSREVCLAKIVTLSAKIENTSFSDDSVSTTGRWGRMSMKEKKSSGDRTHPYGKPFRRRRVLLSSPCRLTFAWRLRRNSWIYLIASM